MKIIKKLPLLFFLVSSQTYAISPWSNKEIDDLEKAFVKQINHADSIERMPLAVLYLNRLGNRLSHAASQPAAYFFIVKSNEINAFAGPGGHIGVNTSLILTTDSESELAAVMAHELAHVRLHHLYYRLQHDKKMRIPMVAALLASIALSVIDPNLASAAVAASLTGFEQNTINFTRAFEKEADRIGIQMLVQAGFDAKGMTRFFKKMQLNSRYYDRDNIPAILLTHPLDQDRISEAENRIATHPVKSLPDAFDYFLFKAIIQTSSTRIDQDLLAYYENDCKKDSSPLACRYGLALSYLHLYKFKKAETLLSSLLANDRGNLYYQLAMAEAEAGNQAWDKAVKRLSALYEKDSNHYAIIRAYADTLILAGKATEATAILLKAFRQFKTDLPLCEQLSRAQAAAAMKNYAYLTHAQCQILQGQDIRAAAELRYLIKVAHADPYLLARAKALLKDVKDNHE